MSRGSVLIVEGNPGAMIVARNVLSRADYVTATAGSPQEGLRKVQSELPDLLLLDAAFASEEALRALSEATPASLPIILSVPTGLGDETKLNLPRLEGVELAGVLEKPYAPDRLLGLVGEVFIDHQSTRPLRIDSGQFKRPPPLPRPTGEDFALPTVMDANQVHVTPARTGRAASTIHDGDDLPPVPWVGDPPLLGAAADGTDTIQETIDAEGACELIDVSVLGLQAPLPRAPSPKAAGGQAVRGGFDVSARAHRLATRIRRYSAEPDFEARLDGVCESALRDEEIFGGLGAPRDGTPPLVAGRLGPVQVSQIFQLAEGFDGPVCCRFERELEAVEVVISGRSLRFARQYNLPEVFRLGRFLVEIGVLGGRNLSRAVNEARRTRRRLGGYLEATGVVTAADITRALGRQATELVYELLAWEAGSFSVFACHPLPPEVTDADMEIPLIGIMLDGLRRRDEWGPTVDSAPTPV